MMLTPSHYENNLNLLRFKDLFILNIVASAEIRVDLYKIGLLRTIDIFPWYWDIPKQCYLKVPISSYLSWKFHTNSPKTHRVVSVLKWEKGVKMLLRILTWTNPFMGTAKKDEAIWVGCHMILV